MRERNVFIVYYFSFVNVVYFVLKSFVLIAIMDGNPPDEPDACAFPKAKRRGWPATLLEQDKKTVWWLGGVMDCFSTVLSLFRKANTSHANEDDDWEIPFAEMSEFLYLGAGAQGIVFRSRLRGEFVAVKKLRDNHETNIKHLRKLNHKNIVRFRGVSVDGPIPCIIMEYCQYGPLFEFIHRGVTIAASQTFEWARDIALGMAYLHNNKIIHRDLKSPNILIADNLRVKVSDFGTAREWNTASAVMSFTGTVAWMAPEVIRHEPCSDRVDIWSYGVVLWELLTQEIPYKNLETHAIMWGVGTDTISLAIPASCPENLQTLLKLCWSRIPKQRPSFKIIAENMEVTGDQFTEAQAECFDVTQNPSRHEIKEGMESFTGSSPQSEAAASSSDVIVNRREEAKNVRDVRQMYEQQLNRANELYMEVCAVRLQLEQRENEVAERENALKACRCGIRKSLKYAQRQTSSSSENVRAEAAQKAPAASCRLKKEATAQVVVNFVEKGEKTVSVVVPQDKVNNVLKEETFPEVESIDNNNISTVKFKNSSIKVTGVVLEQNGNVVKQSGNKNLMSVNANFIPPIAQV